MNIWLAFVLTSALVLRSLKSKSLTPAGITAAIATAITHSLHPSSLPFILLITFYLLGTQATKVKKDIKEQLVILNTGGVAGVHPTSGAAGVTSRNGNEKSNKSGGHTEGRGPIQVLCNSGIASLLILIDYFLRSSTSSKNITAISTTLLLGIITNYTVTTSDTLSSELGILSPTKPVLITSLLSPTKRKRVCPPGTNGGVTLMGLLAGTSGSLIIAGISAAYFKFSSNIGSHQVSTATIVAYITTLGLLGTLLDSLLGALFQPTVIDSKTGKVVENPHGGKVLYEPGSSTTPRKQKIVKTREEEDKEDVSGNRETAGKVSERRGPSRKLLFGNGRTGLLMDNNAVNVSMAAVMSCLGMAGWWVVTSAQ